MEESKNGIDLESKNKAYKNIKDFFTSNMRIKQELLDLAPNEIDDASEESRMEYTDRLYEALRDFEIEFSNMIENLVGDNKQIKKIIQEHFSKSREALLFGHYDKGIIQKIYREQFSNMTPELVEYVKNEFVGYTQYRNNITEAIEKSSTINELLHVMHSYVLNNENLLKSLPVLKTKINEFNYPITLYGEETEISRELFEQFPKDLDVGWTEIVSMPNKILMMVRDRGHAMTIDMDTLKSNDIGVRYFIPKICNSKMVAELPGINTSSISSNGATGFFTRSREDITSGILDFIGKVPMDKDIEEEETIETIKQEEVEPIEPIFQTEDAEELAMEDSKKENRIGIIKYLKDELSKAKDKAKNIFRGEKSDDRTNGD